jgi:Domain of unknown function (DUF5668)
MNRYILIRRLRAPAILLLIGVIALLHQMGVIDHFWHYLVPLILILLGVLLLLERAVLATDGDLASGYPGAPYPGSPYPGAPYPGAPGAPPTTTPGSTSIVPSHSHDFDDDRNGGQS